MLVMLAALAALRLGSAHLEALVDEALGALD
jgi:hypothetical protein